MLSDMRQDHKQGVCLGLARDVLTAYRSSRLVSLIAINLKGCRKRCLRTILDTAKHGLNMQTLLACKHGAWTVSLWALTNGRKSSQKQDDLACQLAHAALVRTALGTE